MMFGTYDISGKDAGYVDAVMVMAMLVFSI